METRTREPRGPLYKGHTNEEALKSPLTKSAHSLGRPFSATEPATRTSPDESAKAMVRMLDNRLQRLSLLEEATASITNSPIRHTSPASGLSTPPDIDRVRTRLFSPEPVRVAEPVRAVGVDCAVQVEQVVDITAPVPASPSTPAVVETTPTPALPPPETPTPVPLSPPVIPTPGTTLPPVTTTDGHTQTTTHPVQAAATQYTRPAPPSHAFRLVSLPSLSPSRERPMDPKFEAAAGDCMAEFMFRGPGELMDVVGRAGQLPELWL